MKWYYECDPAKITGTVEADDEEAANQATTDDAFTKADDSILAGTWTMTRIEDD